MPAKIVISLNTPQTILDSLITGISDKVEQVNFAVADASFVKKAQLMGDDFSGEVLRTAQCSTAKFKGVKVGFASHNDLKNPTLFVSDNVISVMEASQNGIVAAVFIPQAPQEYNDKNIALAIAAANGDQKAKSELAGIVEKAAEYQKTLLGKEENFEKQLEALKAHGLVSPTYTEERFLTAFRRSYPKLKLDDPQAKENAVAAMQTMFSSAGDLETNFSIFLPDVSADARTPNSTSQEPAATHAKSKTAATAKPAGFFRF